MKAAREESSMQHLEQSFELCIVDNDDDSMMSWNNRQQSRRQTRPSNDPDGPLITYRSKSSRRDGRSSSTSAAAGGSDYNNRQLVVHNGEPIKSSSSSSRRPATATHNSSDAKQKQHRRTPTDYSSKQQRGRERHPHDKRSHSHSSSSRQHQQKQHGGHSSKNNKLRHSQRSSSEDQSTSTINTMSTHPSTSNDEEFAIVEYDLHPVVKSSNNEEGGRHNGRKSSRSTLRSSERQRSVSHRGRERGRRSYSPNYRYSSSRSSSRHHHQHNHTRHDRNDKYYRHDRTRSPSLDHRRGRSHRSSSRRHGSSHSRSRPSSPSPDNLRLSLHNSTHSVQSQRSSRTLPVSSHYTTAGGVTSSKRPPRPLLRRRSSDDLYALEREFTTTTTTTTTSNSNRGRSRMNSRNTNHDNDHDYRERLRHHHRSRSRSPSSSLRDYYYNYNETVVEDRSKSEPSVTLRVSKDIQCSTPPRTKKGSTNTNFVSNSRIIQVIDDKTPRKNNQANANSTTNNTTKPKNSIDLTIDEDGLGTFQVVTPSSSSNSAPLKFDIQIDESNSWYLIQTSLGLLSNIREVHPSNTNVLGTLTHWNNDFQWKEEELGYNRGQLGIVSMSSRDMKGGGVASNIPGAKGNKPTFSKRDVVLMTLNGSYHGGKASSFERDDVFIRELELFVMDSLWCYLRLHGLNDDGSESEEDELGRRTADDKIVERNRVRRRNLGSEFSGKGGKKKEPVLSRVFKKVIGD